MVVVRGLTRGAARMHAGTDRQATLSRFFLVAARPYTFPFSNPCCTSFTPCASHSVALPSYPGFFLVVKCGVGCDGSTAARVDSTSHIGRVPLGLSDDTLSAIVQEMP